MPNVRAARASGPADPGRTDIGTGLVEDVDPHTDPRMRRMDHPAVAYVDANVSRKARGEFTQSGEDEVAGAELVPDDSRKGQPLLFRGSGNDDTSGGKGRLR